MNSEFFIKFKDLKILVVDDLATIRSLLVKYLNQLGFLKVEQSADGDLALDFLHKNYMDVLITDWKMPNMTGIDLVKAVRADPKLKPLKILMVTTNSEPAQIEEARVAGVDGYMVKPFSIQILEDNLLSLLHKKPL